MLEACSSFYDVTVGLCSESRHRPFWHVSGQSWENNRTPVRLIRQVWQNKWTHILQSDWSETFLERALCVNFISHCYHQSSSHMVQLLLLLYWLILSQFII